MKCSFDTYSVTTLLGITFWWIAAVADPLQSLMCCLLFCIPLLKRMVIWITDAFLSAAFSSELLWMVVFPTILCTLSRDCVLKSVVYKIWNTQTTRYGTNNHSMVKVMEVTFPLHSDVWSKQQLNLLTMPECFYALCCCHIIDLLDNCINGLV